MVQATRRAADLGAAERRREVRAPFRLAVALRGCAPHQRPALWQRGWREAGCRVIYKRLHLEIVLRTAACEAELPTQPRAPHMLERAHARLARRYLDAGEHGLARDHLEAVQLSRSRYAYAHAPLTAQFHRQLAVCECELHLRDTDLLERPFARDEARAAAQHAKRAAARLKRERHDHLVAKRRDVERLAAAAAATEAEAAARRREKQGRPRMGLSRAERKEQQALESQRAAAEQARAIAEEVKRALRAPPPLTEEQLRREDIARDGAAADAAVDRCRAARAAKAARAWLEDARLRAANAAYERCLGRLPPGPAAATRVAPLLVEAGLVHERLGGRRGERAAARLYGTAIEFYPHRPGYRRACFRAALAAWRARQGGDARGAARARDLLALIIPPEPGPAPEAPEPRAPEPAPEPACAPAPAAADVVDEALAPTPPPPPGHLEQPGGALRWYRRLRGPRVGCADSASDYSDSSSSSDSSASDSDSGSELSEDDGAPTRAQQIRKMARAKAKADALEKQRRADEAERQRIVAERRAASAAYRRAKAQYLLEALDERMARWRARPWRTRYGDDPLCLLLYALALEAAAGDDVAPVERGEAAPEAYLPAAAAVERRVDDVCTNAPGPAPAPAASPETETPRTPPDALRDRAFRSCRARNAFGAAGYGGARHWLGDRRTWRALAEAAADRGEPVLAVEFYARGLDVRYVSPKRRAQTDPENVNAYDRDDDVALLLACGRQHMLLRNPARARGRADAAFALDEWDPRARRVQMAFDPDVFDRCRAEEAAANVLQKKFWRGRVWWPPFWARVKAERIRAAEALVAQDRWGHAAAREDLRYYSPTKWFCLLLYEDAVVGVVQRFLRKILEYRVRVLLDASRHLRTVNAALSAYTRTPDRAEARAQVRAVARDPRTMRDHALHRLAARVRDEDAAVLRLQSAARRRQAAQRFTVLKDEWEMRQYDAEMRRDTLRREADGAVRACRRAAARRAAAARIQARARGAARRAATTRMRAARRFAAACAVARGVRRRARERRAMMRAAEAFDGRIVLARALQRAFRRRLAARGACALFAQARWRGRAGRRAARLAWVRANAADTFAEKWRRRAHLRRYAVLRRRLADRSERVPPRTVAAVARLVAAARRDAADVTDAGAGQRPRTAARPIWVAPGLRGEAIARRSSLAALPEPGQAHPLAGAAAPLFVLHLRAWNCALKTMVVVGAPLHADLAAALGGCRTVRELCLVQCQLGPEALVGLWGAVRAAGLRLEHLHVDDAHHHRALALPGAAREARYGAVGRALGACVGDYVFRQVGLLRRVALCRGGLGDAAAAGVGRALAACDLVELHLDDNRIHTAGAVGLAAGLAANGTLRVLSLADNCVANAGLEALLGALAARPAHGDDHGGAARLDLTRNHTDDRVAPWVCRHAAAFARDPAFWGLALEGNAWRPDRLARVRAARDAAAAARRDRARSPPPRLATVVEASRRRKPSPSPRQFLRTLSTKRRSRVGAMAPAEE